MGHEADRGEPDLGWDTPIHFLRGCLFWCRWPDFFSPSLSHMRFLACRPAFPPRVFVPIVFILLITSSCSLTPPHHNWLVPLACFPTRLWHVFFPLTLTQTLLIRVFIVWSPRIPRRTQPTTPPPPSRFSFICHCYCCNAFRLVLFISSLFFFDLI